MTGTAKRSCHTLFLFHSALVILSAIGFAQAGFTSSNGNTKILTVNQFKAHLARSNKATMVAFFAPWCGHCKNLDPEFEKAATNLKDLVHFVAVDCDAQDNKAACSSEYKVQGFPTIKFFSASPIPTDYQYERKAKALVDYSIKQMPNFSKKVKNLEQLNSLVSKSSSERPLVILFTKATTTTSLFKALSSAIHKKMDVYIAASSVLDLDKLKNRFKWDNLPGLFVFKGAGESDMLKYEGKMNYQDIFKFFQSAHTGKARDEL